MMQEYRNWIREFRMAGPSGETDSHRLSTGRLSISPDLVLRFRVDEEDASIKQWVERLIQRDLVHLPPASADPRG